MSDGPPTVGTFVLLVGDEIDDPLPIGLKSGYADSWVARSAGGPLAELDSGYVDLSAANFGYDDSSVARSVDVHCGGRPSAAAASVALKD